MTLDLRDLYGDELLDHSRSQRNRRALPVPPAASAEGDNPLCGDRVSCFVRVADGRIDDISFQGTGCAISLASASMACDALRGKSPADATDLMTRFVAHLTGDSTASLPDELAPLTGVRAYPMRVKCATLAWHAMRDALRRAQETTA